MIRPNAHATRWTAAALLVALALPRHAQAVDANKAALAMAKSGQAAYEAGQHERAMEFFLQAWQADPGRPAYIYSAARAAHVARKLDLAEQYYTLYLANADKDNKYIERAKSYLEDLAVQRVDVKVAAAEDAEKHSQHALAAKLFADALAMAPQRIHLLLAEGKAWFRARNFDEAERCYRSYLEKAPAEFPERKDAETGLADIAEARRKPAAQPAPPPPFPINRVGGWTVAGLGAATAASGVFVYVLGMSKEDELKAGTGDYNEHNLLYKLSYPQATDLAEAASARKTAGVILGVGGLAMAGFGAFWALKYGEKPLVEPAIGGNGSVAVRVRF